MLKRNNKSKMIIITICLIVTTCIFLVSCTNGITTKKETEDNTSVVGNMTRQQFVFLNYLQQLDENVVMSNLKDFRAAAGSVNSRSSCCFPTIRIFVDNLGNIFDEELYYEIILASGVYYDCEGYIINPFSAEAKEIILDLLGDIADDPACNFDLSLLGVSTNPVNSGFNLDELEHFNSLLHLINDDDTTFKTVLIFLSTTHKNPCFTSDYKLILDSAFYALDYFVDNNLGFSAKLFGSILIVDLATTISEPNDDHIMVLPFLSAAMLKLTGRALKIENGSIIIPCECDTCSCCS